MTEAAVDELCGACAHPMHADRCQVTGTPDGTIVQCSCPGGIRAEIFHGQLLSQISQQLQEQTMLLRIMAKAFIDAQDRRVIVSH